METFVKHTERLLKKDDRLWSKDEDKKLLKNKLVELVGKDDEKLLKTLLSDSKAKKQFFKKIGDSTIFLKDDFIQFVTMNEFLPDSFTAFENKIGLADNRDLLSTKDDVSLVFPYKDCILEGGQEKTDEKRDEIFYNTVLAPDEVDRLKEPKVLTNWKKYDKDGEQEVKEVLEDDNFIIKGNNLLALYSLLPKYRGKVKLIYIDPPYNTGSDEFKYNDRFNHSSWLTFMKNRLELAQKLLDKDGTIFVSINHIELGYLLVLMDNIFGRDNKLPIITLKAGTTASYRSINDCPVNVAEYVLAYSESSNFKPKPVYRESGYSEDYSHCIMNFEDKPENWKLKRLTDIIHDKEGCKNWREYKKKFGGNWKNRRFNEMQKFAFENKEKIVSLNTLQKPSKKIGETIAKSKKTRGRIFMSKRKNAEPVYCYNGRTLAFFSSKFRDIEGSDVPSEILTNLWTDVSFLGIGPEGGVTLENGKKPEYLIKTILELTTEEGDLVLDYHLGSGTTCAVAHKMRRRYIGIEQLDYGDDDSVVRLNNVIQGDKSGISDYDDVNWQGGGNFIYTELLEWNKKYIDELEKAKTKADIKKIYRKIKKEAFYKYQIEDDKFSEKDFNTLSENEQKRVLMDILDMNHLYVNLNSISDATFKVSKKDKELNKKFYQE